MRCEDYPCCGHNDDNPCERQWYDEPGAFDTRVNPHALCDHEAGICDVWEDDDEHDECLSEFGPHDDHDDCARMLALMSGDDDGGAGWEAEQYNRELEAESLGRPLFPNEY